MGVRNVRRFDSTTAEVSQAFQTFLTHTDQKEQALDWLDREVSALGRRGTAIDAGAGTGTLTARLGEMLRIKGTKQCRSPDRR
jgi:hypothetical protein